MAKPKHTEIEVQKPKVTALANWEADAAEEAKDVAAREVIFAPRITHKKGTLSINGAKVEGNKLPCIVIDFGCEKAFYKGKYDPDNTSSPVCYAFGRDEATLAPHPAASEPQAATCAVCPHAKMGTADPEKAKSGKACKDKRRLMVIAANTKANAIGGTEIFNLSVPATSLRNWAGYVKGTRDTFSLPPWGLITEVSTEDFKDYYKLTFNAISKVSGEQWAAIKARQPSVEAIMFAPYPAADAEEAKPKATTKGKKKLD
jgi:hypothetical protein